MGQGLTYITENYHNMFYGFLKHAANHHKKLLVTGELMKLYDDYAEQNTSNDELRSFIEKIQETVSFDHTFFLDIRERIASTLFYRINLEEFFLEEISPKEYLANKEICANPSINNRMLNLNFKPFYDKSPKVRDTKYIGSGVEYLNRFLSSQMFTDSEKWKNLFFDFIKLHKHNGEQLILNDRIKDPEHLKRQIDSALKRLSAQAEFTPYNQLKHSLQELGFENGLGKNAKEIIKNLNVLDQLLNSPDHNVLMKFISSIPMVFKIAIISPHGYFAQEGVLGLPDTGGQVVYILDQVKALEKAMFDSIKQSGLDVMPKIVVLTRLIPNAQNTNCNKRLEKIYGTKNSWILRVPFRDHNKKVTDNWISRFEIWPYLEEFAEDSYTALMAEFSGRPDLIIGNYSDGNLVAYLLSKSFKVTQCGIAHALEKSKYLYSGLYWYDLEKYYHFSMQFTADLIAINSADFLITSSFQEIAGTEKSIGQYESYEHFTMPGLYRVTNGVDPRHVKFNIVSPGVNENIFFPYTKKNLRIKETTLALQDLLFRNFNDENSIGALSNPNKIPIFSMARLDRIKNITFLVECFGESEELQNISNLIIVAGKINEDLTSDNEEKEQIRIMHDLINKYQLHDKIRWIGKLFPKDEAGEVYRIIADKKGIFVQPALFEGFGLTVLEAMISGLPVFATKYGGPLEIIQDKVNGFHIDPVNKTEVLNILLGFLKEAAGNSKMWDSISKNAIKRVNEKYNWRLYTEKLLSLSKLYGFWKYSTNLEHKDMDAYLDIIYHTLFKPRAEKLFEEHAVR
jgi:sucrose synthase